MISKVNYSVVIISYNQEHLIARAIESVISQYDYIYELIISDDCSTDNTWNVITNYQSKYPSIIKAYRNEINLGIFGHIESIWSKVNGDVVFTCAGDDVLCYGLFAKANELVNGNNINHKHDAFVLYFDFKIISPNGEEEIFSNALIEKHNSVSLKLRNLIFNRTSGVSRAVFSQYFPVNKEIGIYADGLLDIQRHIFSQRNYYLPFIGSIYYSGIGISSRTHRNDHILSYIKCLKLFLEIIPNLTKKDIQWINYLEARLLFEFNPTVKHFLKYLGLLLIISEFTYGFNYIKREYKQFTKLILNKLGIL